jgi:ribosomal protein S18 acetylase RimI-like enzyme
MPYPIAEPLRAPNRLDRTERQKQFKSFSCGRRGRHWEVEVNGWAKRVYHARTTEPQTILAVEDAIGRGLGLVSLKPRALEVEEGRIVDGLPYIFALGVDRRYHGKGVGSKLLQAVLDEVQSNWQPVPAYIWAYVHPDNEESHALFEKYGFALRDPVADGHDAIRLLQRY